MPCQISSINKKYHHLINLDYQSGRWSQTSFSKKNEQKSIEFTHPPWINPRNHVAFFRPLLEETISTSVNTKRTWMWDIRQSDIENQVFLVTKTGDFAVNFWDFNGIHLICWGFMMVSWWNHKITPVDNLGGL